jgi:hypothetical protein
MIAEHAQHTDQETRKAAPTQASLSLTQVVGSMQVMLATRRAARNAERALWYTINRSL